MVPDGMQDENDDRKIRLKELTNKLEAKRSKLAGLCITPCINDFAQFNQLASSSIYDCSPGDYLHVFLVGWLENAVTSTIAGLWPDSAKLRLDELARSVVESNPSTARKNFPRYPIDRGMSNLSMVSLGTG